MYEHLPIELRKKLNISDDVFNSFPLTVQKYIVEIALNTSNRKQQEREVDVDIYISPDHVTDYEEIGQGGFGKVYKAKMDNRYIAVKRLITSISDDKYTYKTYRPNINRSDVINEAKKLVKLWNRGGIVNFLGIIRDGNKSISLAMEYVNGGTLRDYVSEKGSLIGWEGKRILLSKIADALHMCHEAGIVHSDIKAENILMDHHLNPKISDFGASILNDDDTDINYAASLPWTAPERFIKGNTLSKPTIESDVYSFGILSYEVLNNGHHPYENKIYTHSLLIRSIKKFNVVYPDNFPLEFVDILKECLKKNPDERINMLDVIDKLSSFDYLNVQMNRIMDTIKDEPSIIGMIISMSILMAQNNHHEASLLMGIMECWSGDLNNAKNYIKNPQAGNTLAEVLRKNNMVINKKLYHKCISMSLDDILFFINNCDIELTDDFFIKYNHYKYHIMSNVLKRNLYSDSFMYFKLKNLLSTSDSTFANITDFSWLADNIYISNITLINCTISNFYIFDNNLSINTIILNNCNVVDFSCLSSVKNIEMDAETIYNIANSYYNGINVEQDYEKALEWYMKAAENNHSNSQYYIGDLYKCGKGVEQCYEKAMEWYMKAAEQNNNNAQYNIGDLYYHGKGVEQCYEKTMEWYMKAAENNHSGAQNDIGYLYQYGFGVDQNYEKAMEWYMKAANNNNKFAYSNIGNLYEYGNGVERNYEKAKEWYMKGTGDDINDSDTQYDVGNLYKYGENIDQSYEKAMEWYMKAAEKNHSGAQYNIANLYEHGKGVEQSYEKAFEWYMKAAKHNHSTAQWNIGNIYEYGRGVERSYEKAMEWYIKAAGNNYRNAQRAVERLYKYFYDVELIYEKVIESIKNGKNGNGYDQYEVGVNYENGYGVEQNYEKAMEYYMKAAEHNYCMAQYNIGVIYQNGLGVEQDYEKAMEWYMKAAENNHSTAQWNIGVMYQTGLEIDQNHEKAMEWYMKAAENGYSVAQHNIGVMYQNGLGVEQDYDKAMEWYMKAAEQNDNDSQYKHDQGVEQYYDKAMEWYMKAAEQNDSHAQYNIGALYESVQNYKKAMKWYMKAAGNNHSDAQNIIGDLYENGYGVEQNYRKAMNWYIKAAKNNHSGAQCNTGFLYANGYGIEQDYNKAMKWYMKAAEQNNSNAQYNIGVLYENGQGVKQDYKKAMEWYIKANKKNINIDLLLNIYMNIGIK